MRRISLLVSLLALFGLIAAGSLAAAQEATPAATMVELPAPLDAYVAAWAEHDPAKIASLYAEDATLSEMVLDGPVLHGPAEIEQWAMVNFTGFPDLHLEPVAASATADHATLEWVYTGSFTGEIPGLGAGQGQTIAIPGVSVMELRDGKIVRDAFYYDRATFLSQFMGDTGGSQAEADGTPTS